MTARQRWVGTGRSATTSSTLAGREAVAGALDGRADAALLVVFFSVAHDAHADLRMSRTTQLYGNEVLAALLSQQAAGAPVAGSYAYGEIARTAGRGGFHNQTLGVLAVG